MNNHSLWTLISHSVDKAQILLDTILPYLLKSDLTDTTRFTYNLSLQNKKITEYEIQAAIIGSISNESIRGI